MNTYEIKNINPEVDVTNTLIAIRFDMHATDASGNVADATWYNVYSTPMSALPTYTSANLMALCQTVATDNNIQAMLDAILARRSLPVSQSNPDITSSVPVPLTDAQQRTVWMAEIDDAVASTYDRFQRFQMEYVNRESAATTYKAAGYTGDPTIWITRFADNTGITYQQCADLILTQAANLRSALAQLAALRMDKYKVQGAATPADALAAFNAVMSQRNAIDTSLA